ncbi:MAG: hypothetical protein COZ23_07980 [Hydrogenophilales bacterium CG_4_10_14_3_um_filter_58_23]|nr:MAG: hypothetical protein COZ23_07980 [Hydrogenophilales bacterium CG_4_10_14_3_um_filter_58_23]
MHLAFTALQVLDGYTGFAYPYSAIDILKGISDKAFQYDRITIIFRLAIEDDTDIHVRITTQWIYPCTELITTLMKCRI